MFQSLVVYNLGLVKETLEKINKLKILELIEATQGPNYVLGLEVL